MTTTAQDGMLKKFVLDRIALCRRQAETCREIGYKADAEYLGKEAAALEAEWNALTQHEREMREMRGLVKRAADFIGALPAHTMPNHEANALLFDLWDANRPLTPTNATNG